MKAFRIENLEDVRVIRDKVTGKSRQFGFLRFSSLEDSKAFVEQNSPVIHLYGNAADGQDAKSTPVKISFCRERGARDQVDTESEWQCPSCGTANFSTRRDCRRCGTSGADALVVPIPPPAPVNTGDSDVAPDGLPSQYLLFRSLEATVTEELLAKGAMKLLKSDEPQEVSKDDTNKTSANKITSTSSVAQAGARRGCIRRVFIVRDRLSNDSWRYGFVEFAAVEDAQAALAKFLSITKFTIKSKPVIVSYVHAGVFVPDLQIQADTARFVFTALTNPGLKLAYWDQNGYASALDVTTAEEDVDAADKDAGAKASKDAKPKKRKVDAASSTSEVKPKKQMASHLQFWTNRAAELRGLPADSAEPSNDTDDPEPPSDAPLGARRVQLIERSPFQSYADPQKHCCYLCSRQFKSAAEVNKHERLSELHRTNLTNEDLLAKARERLQKLGIPLVSTDLDGDADAANADTDAGQEYRDRAKERRRTHAQPKQAGFQQPPAKVSTSASAPALPTEPRQSKAALMLAKMGHTPGAGLGSSMAGSAAPIETNVYAAGVGLGAEGGKLGDAVKVADRATKNDYGAFVKDVRDRARERFAKEG